MPATFSNAVVGSIVMDDTDERFFCQYHEAEALRALDALCAAGCDPTRIILDRSTVDRLATERDEGLTCAHCGHYL